jgi:enoyl-CoA hydratase/carnithine racemase
MRLGVMAIAATLPLASPTMLRIDDQGRVRILTLNRPEALNAFNEALYDATTDALIAAADDPGVAVVVLTGEGRAFSAGTDLLEMAARTSDPDFRAGRHGFAGLVDSLTDFPKPFVCAVNGIGLGVGATILGFADLAFMSRTARLKCPFTSLGVAPEAASSFTFPRLVGRQQATWALMSSEWLGADQCFAMGLVFAVCEPDELLGTTMDHARVLAAQPISSLVETKRAIMAPLRDEIVAARARENAAFAKLMAGPANAEALRAFAEKRAPDFTTLPPGW